MGIYGEKNYIGHLHTHKRTNDHTPIHFGHPGEKAFPCRPHIYRGIRFTFTDNERIDYGTEFIPAGTFRTLMIRASQVQKVIEDPRVHAVTLTGSEPAGRQVAATAGTNLKKSVLELGGSDAFIVLEDADLDVRACAIVGLTALRAPAAVEPLTARLSDPSAYVSRLAADGLARFGDVATAELIITLETGDTVARIGAARALRSLEAEEAIPALCAALDDPSAAVAHYAEEALERLGVGMVYFRP